MGTGPNLSNSREVTASLGYINFNAKLDLTNNISHRHPLFAPHSYHSSCGAIAHAAYFIALTFTLDPDTSYGGLGYPDNWGFLGYYPLVAFTCHKYHA